ncbi:RHS repeat-associated core domain-containing protein, partial [Streptomyces sp. NPDC087849]|uniref:RHS repeat-associated core domain-containing protein n=1 Tax=Streptomyces sp. NPDC087849 TaxID=3365808 RepID=UPI00381D01CB
WGTTTWSATSIAYTPLRFPGQYFDPETGLHYNFHRHYDPETARYLSVDPLGIAPSPNSGAYVENPHTGADPFGLAPCPEVNPRKLDYLFNKDVKPDPHNTPRAIQNANQLKSIGFHDTPASRQFVTEHLKEATGNGFSEHFTNEWGNFGKTKSVLYGPHGMLGVESTWQIMPDGGYRLSTVIFRS